MMRPLAELLATDQPAWPLVQGWLESASNSVEALPPSADRDDQLYRSQVTVRSALGAVIHETGGLLIDHGWIRLLGSGHPSLGRSLADWNAQIHGPTGADLPTPFTLIADDAAGGFYALHNPAAVAAGVGGLLTDSRVATVYFFAPDRMVWEDMGGPYTDFLQWALFGDLNAYYKTLRWPGWQSDLARLRGNQSFLLNPVPFSSAGAVPASAEKIPVDTAKLYRLYVEEFAPKLAGLKPGDPFSLELPPGFFSEGSGSQSLPC